MPSARVPVAPSRRLLRCVAVASALACSAAVSVGLPGAVAAADELAGTTVVGQLVQLWAEGEHPADDHADDSAGDAAGEQGAEGPLSYVETAAGSAVRVPTQDVGDLPVGATVSVTVGAQLDDEAAGEDGVEPARTVLASDVLVAPAPSTAAGTSTSALTNEVTVVLVAPAGTPKDATKLTDVVRTVNGSVADFWAEQSDGAIRVGVTASHDWTTPTAGCADPTKLWDQAAAAVGFVAGRGKHLMLYVSQAAKDCSYALAEVGAGVASGGRMYVRDVLPSVIAHELGHNFGLGHSSGRQCDAAVETGNCLTAPYRDFYDVMGVSWGQLGSLNGAQAARLGVLPDATVASLSVQSGSTAVTLSPLGGRTGTRVLRLTDAEGFDYWLEYRTPTARDAWLAGGNRYGLDAGVLLRRAGQSFPDTSLLLDATPSAASGWDADLQAALPVGTAVPISGGDFTVHLRSLSAAGAVLDVVSFPTAERGAPAPPAVSAPAGTVMSGMAEVAAPANGVAAPVAEVAAPIAEAAPPARLAMSAPDTDLRPTAAQTLDAASQSSSTGLVIALAGAALGGGLVLAVRGMRRRGLLSR